MYWLPRLSASVGALIVALPAASVVPTACCEPTVTGAQPSTPPGPSAPSKMRPHFLGSIELNRLPTHELLVWKTFTIAFGTGMVLTTGFGVLSCMARTLNATFSVADALIVCESVADVLVVKEVLPP